MKLREKMNEINALCDIYKSIDTMNRENAFSILITEIEFENFARDVFSGVYDLHELKIAKEALL